MIDKYEDIRNKREPPLNKVKAVISGEEKRWKRRMYGWLNEERLSSNATAKQTETIVKISTARLRTTKIESSSPAPQMV